MALRLLFITPKIDEQHDDLAFASLWVKAFQDDGYEVTVICGAKGATSLECPIYALNHQDGMTRLRSFMRFQKLIISLKYDRVFVHLGQRWLGAGVWWWWLRCTPTYLWYTHYTRPWSLRIGMWMVKRAFAATQDSLPQYDHSQKKVVTGHGIDTTFWDVPVCPESERKPITQLLAVHRLSRSKRLEIVLRALALLPEEYTLTHYGRSQDVVNESSYLDELKTLTCRLGISDRVNFMGAVPMPKLREIYPRYRVCINMVPGTIDKTVLEAMYCGVTPVITMAHAKAIGYSKAPRDESPAAVANYVSTIVEDNRENLQAIVRRGHELRALIKKMSVYISPGI